MPILRTAQCGVEEGRLPGLIKKGRGSAGDLSAADSRGAHSRPREAGFGGATAAAVAGGHGSDGQRGVWRPQADHSMVATVDTVKGFFLVDHRAVQADPRGSVHLGVAPKPGAVQSARTGGPPKA